MHERLEREKSAAGTEVPRPECAVGGAAAVLALQRSVGNRGVAALARKGAKKPAVKTFKCTVAASGLISNEAGDPIGLVAADGNAYATADGSSATAAPAGTLEAGGTSLPIAKLVKVTLAATSGDTTYTPTRKQVGVVVSGGVPAAVAFRGNPDGDPDRGGGRPVAPADLPESVRVRLSAGSRLRWTGGYTWLLMSYPSADRSTTTLTWVSSREKKSAFETRHTQVEAASHDLPQSVRDRVGSMLDPFALVSLIEGPWRSVSPATDPMASLGVYQWGLTKDKVDTGGSSLGKFFSKLKSRAEAAEKKGEDQRSEEEKMFVSAWQQCRAKGLNTSGSTIMITKAGKETAATGREVEALMADEMSKGALKNYQFVAVEDEIRSRVGSWTVRPLNTKVGGKKLPFAKAYLGNEADNISKTGGIQFTRNGRKVVLAVPSWAIEVSNVVTDAKALALLLNLQANRPAFVPTTVWLAMTGRGSGATTPEARTTALLDKILEGQQKADAAAAAAESAKPPEKPAKGGKSAKAKKPKPPPDISDSNAADKASLTALQEIVWPRTRTVNQATLTKDLYTAAMELYIQEGGRGWPARRARRLATTELLD